MKRPRKLFKLRVENLETRFVLATFQVNVLGDLPDATAPGDGIVDVDLEQPGNQVSLRGALEEANAIGGTNQIVLESDEYILDSPVFVISDVTISGNGIGRTTIDGNEQSRIFIVSQVQAPVAAPLPSDMEFASAGQLPIVSTGILRLSDLTIANGVAPNDYEFSVEELNGGAILNISETFINRVEFRNNTARFGGAIANYGQLTVQSGSFHGNQAEARGGAIFTDESDEFTDRFDQLSTVSVSKSSFIGNSSENVGGGIYVGDGELEVDESEFRDNRAFSGGGGLGLNLGTTQVSRSLFAGNSSREGAVIENEDGVLAVVSSTFSENSSECLDDACSILAITDDGTTDLVNVTISGNSGTALSSTSGGRFRLRNTVISSNIISEDDSEITSFGGNFFSEQPEFDLRSTDSVGDAQLGVLQDNGGPTLSISPLRGSPLVDAGIPDDSQSVDQRGFPRTVNTIDIGAVETDFLPLVFANPDFLTVRADRDISFQRDSFIEFLLSNDEGDGIRLQDIDPVGSSGGRLTSSGSTIVYTPPSQTVADEEFTYTIIGTEGVSATGSIQVSRQSADGEVQYRMGEGLRAVAVSPIGASDQQIVARMAAVSDLDNKLTIFDVDESLMVQQEVEVQLSSRPWSLDYSADGSTIAVAAVGRGSDDSGAIFVVRNGTVVDTLTAGKGPVDVALADLDGDGVEDYASVSFRSNDIGFHSGASGSFVKVGLGNNPQRLAVGDLNGDGRSDIAVANVGYGSDVPTVDVYLNSASGFGNPRTVVSAARIVDLAIADFDDDGRLELLSAAENGRVDTYPLSGGQLNRQLLFNGTGQLRAFHVATNEIALASFSSQSLDRYQRNNGDYILVSSSPVSSPMDVVSLGDLNGLVDGAAYATAGLYDPQIQFRGVVEVSYTGPFDDFIAVVLPVVESRSPQVFAAASSGTAADNTPARTLFDVNGDSMISPLDALLIINQLMASASATESLNTDYVYQTDINSDGETSPLDALLVINELGSKRVDSNVRRKTGFVDSLLETTREKQSVPTEPDGVTLPIGTLTKEYSTRANSRNVDLPVSTEKPSFRNWETTHVQSTEAIRDAYCSFVASHYYLEPCQESPLLEVHAGLKNPLVVELPISTAR